MAKENRKEAFKLDSVEGINHAIEWTFNKQANGEIDGKGADAYNTTIKAATYLNVKLKMDYQKMWMQARMKKIDLPRGFLPEIDALMNKSEDKIEDKIEE